MTPGGAPVHDVKHRDSLGAITLKIFSKIRKRLIIKQINRIRSSLEVSNSEHLAGLIFKHDDRLVSAAAIQTLHKMATEYPNTPVLLPEYFIDPNPESKFRMFVLDIFGVNGKGTCVSGIVSSRSIEYGNKLILKKADGRNIDTECTDIRFFQEPDNIEPGCTIGIFLKNVSMGEIS